MYFAAHLRLVRSGVHHLAPARESRRDHLLDMPRGSILVCFDIRRYDPELVEIAAAAESRGVKIVSITDQWMSPVAGYATNVLTAHTEVPSVWDSNAALVALVEIILAEATRQSWDSVAQRLKTLEDLRVDGPTDRTIDRIEGNDPSPDRSSGG
jgi:DNA-binding MurR/RpiR family transcriptional regulator